MITSKSLGINLSLPLGKSFTFFSPNKFSDETVNLYKLSQTDYLNRGSSSLDTAHQYDLCGFNHWKKGIDGHVLVRVAAGQLAWFQ